MVFFFCVGGAFGWGVCQVAVGVGVLALFCSGGRAGQILVSMLHPACCLLCLWGVGLFGRIEKRRGLSQVWSAPGLTAPAAACPLSALKYAPFPCPPPPLASTQTIGALDEKKREALEKTWRKVNEDFGAIFSTLLPGTTAKLEPQEGRSFLEGKAVAAAI